MSDDRKADPPSQSSGEKLGGELDPRLAGLSPAKRALLERRLGQRRSGERQGRSIPRRTERGPAPLSFAQERLWFLDQLEPGGSAYNRPASLRLTGMLDERALELALNEIVRRHEVLRTTFPVEGERPVQRVAPAQPLELPVVDLRTAPEEERETRAEGLAKDEARQPFDLGRGPLLRATLLRLSATEYVLLLTVHHIAFDGWSMGVLVEELTTLYTAFAVGQPSPLPEPPIQYADFASWQRGWLRGEVLEKRLSYWKRQLGGAPAALDLPTDRPRPPVRTSNGALRTRLLPEALSADLKELSRREGVTLFMLLLAAFQALLYRYTGQDDISVGTPTAGRDRVEMEGLIGFFVNTLVLRTDLSEDPTFRELLGRVREVALGAYAQGDVPFEKLVEELRPERDTSRTPFFQVMFQLRNVPRKTVGSQTLEIDDFEFDDGTAKFDLSLDVIETAEGLRCRCAYNTDLFEEATVSRMLEHLQTLLEEVVQDSDRRVSRLTPLEAESVARRETSSAIFVGEGSLLARCAEVFLEAGHRVHGIVSSEPLVERWAEENGIPHVASTDDVVGFMRRAPFDYLFSAVNPWILPKEVLALPRKLAINFHDAPLPRYAGVRVTSWALIHGEQTHGVTWHEMAERVDAGRILKQRLVEVGEDETTLSLNAKCYEAGLQSFVELISDISSGRLAPSDPGLEERTYFSKYERPDSAAVISWERSAEEIESLVRALMFGPYRNPLGLPRIYLGEEAVIARKAEILDAPSRSAPGTVVSVGDGGLRVATGSRDIVLRELLTIDGLPLPVVELKHRFDVRVGQRLPEIGPEQAKRLTRLNNGLARHEEFWVGALSRMEPIRLPHVRQEVSSASPARYASVTIPVPEGLAALADHIPGWNAGDLLISAFAVYLSRLGGKREFDLGFGESALRRELAGLPGLFATWVPLRVDLGRESSIGEVLQAMRDAIDLVREHKTYVRDVVARYPELGFLPTQEGWPGLPVIAEYVEDLEGYELPGGSELALIVAPDGSACRWVYDPDAITAEDVASMQRQFARVLRAVMEDGDRPLGELSLLSDEERRQILFEWSGTKTDHPKDRCVHQIFEAQAARNPGAVALVFEDQQLTYGELNDRANRLAHHLKRLGVGPEVLVGICVERSPALVVGLLGVLKAGGAYVPLDPEYPEERLSFILQDARVTVLLTQGRVAGRLPEHGAEVLCLDMDRERIAAESGENPASRAGAEDLAYVMYTSGSTGRPKGVMIERHALNSYVAAAAAAYELSALDRVLQFASPSFDASVEEIFPCLARGGALVLRSDRMIGSIRRFVHECREREISVLSLPTGFWHELVLAFESEELALPPSVRLMIIGGEKALARRVEQWHAHVSRRNHPARLINTYGPTEATVIATLCELRPEASLDLQTRGEAPIGRPLGDAQVYILDEHSNPVPVGVEGELCIGGPMLARGYLNRPALTVEKFVLDPFGYQPRARLYRTGDVARWRGDGAIEYAGRLDDQVKIRGFRVEPGEVEAVLAEHPAVRACAIVAREDEAGQRLVAYVAAGREPEPGEWRNWLKRKLPEYMLPSSFVFLEELPRTPNGKIDRAALPTLARQGAKPGLVEPRTPTEEGIAEVWRALLRLKRVGVHEDFFELGGHSLLAVQVMTRLERRFGVELLLSTIFDTLTVAGLAEHIEELRRSDAPVSSTAILRSDDFDEGRL